MRRPANATKPLAAAAVIAAAPAKPAGPTKVYSSAFPQMPSAKVAKTTKPAAGGKELKDFMAEMGELGAFE